MNRRQLLIATPLVLIGGCSLVGLTPTQALAQAAQDAQTIATAFTALLPQLATIAGVTPGTIARVGQAVADLQSVASALIQATSVAQALPLVQQLEADLNAVIGALAMLPLPLPVAAALQAASVLLPLIELAVGMVVTPKVAARARALAMTPDQARVILKGATIR